MEKPILKDGLKKRNTKKVEEIKFRCFKCEKELPESKFYLSYSECFRHVGVCKDCLSELFDMYVDRYENIPQAMIRMCTIMDMYYTQTLLETNVKKHLDRKKKNSNDPVTSVFKGYMKAIRNMTQYQGKTFKNSDINNKEADISNIDVNTLSENAVKWGLNYKDEEYEILNRKYQEWCKTTPHEAQADISTIRDICRQELALDKDPTNDKAQSLKMNLIKQAGLDGASRKKEKKEDSSELELGNKIAELERTRPADLFDNQELFRDVRGNGEYYLDHYVRPTRNMVQDLRDFPDVHKYEKNKK